MFLVWLMYLFLCSINGDVKAVQALLGCGATATVEDIKGSSVVMRVWGDGHRRLWWSKLVSSLRCGTVESMAMP